MDNARLSRQAKKQQKFLEDVVPGYLKKSHDTLPSPTLPSDSLFESDQPEDESQVQGSGSGNGADSTNSDHD